MVEIIITILTAFVIKRGLSLLNLFIEESAEEIGLAANKNMKLLEEFSTMMEALVKEMDSLKDMQ